MPAVKARFLPQVEWFPLDGRTVDGLRNGRQGKGNNGGQRIKRFQTHACSSHKERSWRRCSFDAARECGKSWRRAQPASCAGGDDAPRSAGTAWACAAPSGQARGTLPSLSRLRHSAALPRITLQLGDIHEVHQPTSGDGNCSGLSATAAYAQMPQKEQSPEAAPAQGGPQCSRTVRRACPGRTRTASRHHGRGEVRAADKATKGTAQRVPSPKRKPPRAARRRISSRRRRPPRARAQKGRTHGQGHQGVPRSATRAKEKSASDKASPSSHRHQGRHCSRARSSPSSSRRGCVRRSSSSAASGSPTPISRSRSARACLAPCGRPVARRRDRVRARVSQLPLRRDSR